MGQNSQASIRRRILKERGVTLEKHTRKPQTVDEVQRDFKKTSAMKYVELKFGKPIEELIFGSSIYKIGKALSLDPSTISKWRKTIAEAKERKFWGEFKEEKDE